MSPLLFLALASVIAADYGQPPRRGFFQRLFSRRQESSPVVSQPLTQQRPPPTRFPHNWAKTRERQNNRDTYRYSIINSGPRETDRERIQKRWNERTKVSEVIRYNPFGRAFRRNARGEWEKIPDSPTSAPPPHRKSYAEEQEEYFNKPRSMEQVFGSYSNREEYQPPTQRPYSSNTYQQENAQGEGSMYNQLSGQYDNYVNVGSGGVNTYRFGNGVEYNTINAH